MTHSINSQTEKGGEETEVLTAWFILENSSSSSNKVCFKVQLWEICSSLITEGCFMEVLSQNIKARYFFLVYL